MITTKLSLMLNGEKCNERKFMLPKMRQTYALLVMVFMVGGCQSLLPSQSAIPPTLYSLDTIEPGKSGVAGGVADKISIPTKVSIAADAPVLIVSPPRAAAGFDSPRIIYMRQEHKLEYFAQSRWVAAPGTMLVQLIVNRLSSSRAFSAVVPAPTSVVGQLRLDIEVMRLQQDFTTTPSRVRLTLRAHLLDNLTRNAIAWREFDAIVPSASEDTYGGVVAANEAVHQVLEEITIFCEKKAAEVHKKTNE
ncbi:MAG: ABC-type transport auxiliary lipoprotein family protein [Pseudomonadota bacterium]